MRKWLKNYKPQFKYDKHGTIWDGESKRVLDIRGWGFLTSPSCQGLTPDEAIEVQDELARFICKKLNELEREDD